MYNVSSSNILWHAVTDKRGQVYLRVQKGGPCGQNIQMDEEKQFDERQKCLQLERTVAGKLNAQLHAPTQSDRRTRKQR